MSCTPGDRRGRGRGVRVHHAGRGPDAGIPGGAMSQRIDTQQMYETFRANHRDPRNLALHLVGYWLILRALKRLFTGHVWTAALNLGAGLGILVSGHRLEGTEPFTIFREARRQRAATGNGHAAA